MRGLGKPLQDDSVELSVTVVRALPWPRLSAADEAVLVAAAEGLASRQPGHDRAVRTFARRARRRELDDQVFDLLGASARLRAVVAGELVRPAG